MISPVQPGSAQAVYNTQTIQSQQSSTKTNQASTQQYHDSVHLSQAAKASASQDVDHDGDSH